MSIAITAHQEAIRDAVTAIDKYVGDGKTMPVLGGFLLEAAGDSATLRATDLESMATATFKCQVEEGGTVLLPKLFRDIVTGLDHEDVSIAGGLAKGVTIANDGREYKIAIMDAQDYPDPFAPGKAECRFTLRQADLGRLIRGVAWAAAVRDPRKMLMGILLQVSVEGERCEITGVTTDGLKLARYRIQGMGASGEGGDFIIPIGKIPTIERQLGDEGTVEITLHKKMVAFDFGARRFCLQLLEGKYPAYDSVIPKTFKGEVEIDRHKLLREMKRAAVVAEQKHGSVICKFAPEILKLEAQRFECGAFEGKVAITGTVREKLAFNSNYMIEALEHIESKAITMQIKEANAPVLLLTKDDPALLALVMPVRLAEVEEAQADPKAAPKGDEDGGEDEDE